MKKKHQEADGAANVEDDITKFQTRINPQTGKREIYWKSDIVEPDKND